MPDNTLPEHGAESVDTGQLISDLQALRDFPGTPEEFWRTFLDRAASLAMARTAALLVRPSGDPDVLESGALRSAHPPPSPLASPLPQARPEGQPIAVAAAMPERSLAAWREPALFERAAEAASRALDRGLMLVAPSARAPAEAFIAVRLATGPGQPAAALVLMVEPAPVEHLEASAVLMRLVSDVPAGYQRERSLRQASGDVARFAEALDLMALLNEDVRFMKAAMTFVNEVASRHRCGRVSLGWLSGGYVRVQAMSHSGQFEARTGAVQSLEAAMEECFDQDQELVWPRPAGSRAVLRSHEAFALAHGSGNLVSVPVRVSGRPEAVLTCERAAAPFTEDEVRALRLLCDQAARRLEDLRARDRWFGARLLAWLRTGAGHVVGFEHTFAKLAGLAAAAVLAFLLLGTWPYRIEASFILRTDEMRFMPAPFEGYIDEVRVTIADTVKKGDLLVSLDTRELVLDETAALADVMRQQREAEKARARNALADMKIAIALEAQGRARADRARHQIEEAQVRAPIDAVVVEGDLRKMIGAPVRKGDVLLKLAALANIHAEAEVDERDVHLVTAGMSGEIAFVARPQETFPIRVERLDPVAVPKEGGNVFIARALSTGVRPAWWRPGMSGVAKLDVGRRSALWVLTHRAADWLRLALWW